MPNRWFKLIFFIFLCKASLTCKLLRASHALASYREDLMPFDEVPYLGFTTKVTGSERIPSVLHLLHYAGLSVHDFEREKLSVLNLGALSIEYKSAKTC
jgi:hypothetical protein